MKVDKKKLIEQIEAVLTSKEPMRVHAVGKALVHLFNRQTREEQIYETTNRNNGIGFTGAHGEIGTSMAKFYMKRGFLTPKQIDYWQRPIGKKNRPRIMMYKKQLLEEAIKKQTQNQS